MKADLNFRDISHIWFVRQDFPSRSFYISFSLYVTQLVVVVSVGIMTQEARAHCIVTTLTALDCLPTSNKKKLTLLAYTAVLTELRYIRRA